MAAVAVGDGAYRRHEIQRDLGIAVLAELPDDPTAASAVRTAGVSSARLHRSRLARAVAGLGGTITALVERDHPGAWAAKAS